MHLIVPQPPTKPCINNSPSYCAEKEEHQRTCPWWRVSFPCSFGRAGQRVHSSTPCSSVSSLCKPETPGSVCTGTGRCLGKNNGRQVMNHVVLLFPHCSKCFQVEKCTWMFWTQYKISPISFINFNIMWQL